MITTSIRSLVLGTAALIGVGVAVLLSPEAHAIGVLYQAPYGRIEQAKPIPEIIDASADIRPAPMPKPLIRDRAIPMPWTGSAG